MKIFRPKLLLMVLIGIIAVIFFWQYINRYLLKPKAAGDLVNVTFTPKSGDYKISETKTLDIVIQAVESGKKISGLDLTFLTEGNISFIGMTPPASFPLETSSPLKQSQIKNDIKENEAHIVYAFMNPDNELPLAVIIKMSFKGTAGGLGKIKLDREKSQVVGNTGSGGYSFGKVDEAAFNFSEGRTISGTPSPTVIPGPSVSLKIDPPSLIKAIGDDFTIRFRISDVPEGKKISGFDAALSFNKDLLEVANIADPIDGVTGADSDKFTKIKKSFDNKTGEILLNYISLLPQDQLPSQPVISIQLKARAVGKGEFKITKAQVTGNISENVYQNNIFNNTYEIVEGPTPTPSSSSDSATLKLKLKFQGLLKNPPPEFNIMRVKITLAGLVSGKPVKFKPAISDFTADENGVWQGSAAFSNVIPGGGYKVLVKGPKHLQKKICDAAPKETFPGTYSCDLGNIELKNGVNELDFSKIVLLAGDIAEQDGEQNGIVNAYDISVIKNNLGSKDPKILSIGDLNLDGIIDSQDYSLVLAALSIRQDEE